MKTLAGVLLIFMCLINGVAGIGYLLGGALFNIGGEVAKEESKVENKESKDKTAAAAMASDSAEKDIDKDIAKQDDKNSKDLADAGKKAKEVGAGLSAFGAFLGIVAVGQLVVSIMFFTKSGAGKVAGLVIGGAGILAEGIGIALTSFGVTNALGIIVGGLAIAAALMKTNPPVGGAGSPPGGPAYPPPGYPPGQGGPPPGPPYGGG